MANTQSPKADYPRMTAKEYQAARMRFEDISDLEFVEMIGVSWRQGERYWDGSSGIPDSVAKLLRNILKHKLTPDDIV
jgi:hypothetical protein